MLELNKQDMIDVLYGCTVLGTGGGGGIRFGFDIMKEDFEAGRILKVMPLDELADDDYICLPYGVGAPAAIGAELPPNLARLTKVKSSSEMAFHGLEEEIGHKFSAVSSAEMGGMSTAEAMHIACLLDIPLADGDPAGRAVPEIPMSTFNMAGLKSEPVVVVTKFGETLTLKNMIDDERIEDLIRSIAHVSGDDLDVADHAMSGKEYKNAIIPNAITDALKIGRIIREEREAGKSGRQVAEAIVDAMGGEYLFQGTVTDMPWELRDGFQFGDVYLDGKNDYEGEKYHVFFKNENVAAYRNDKFEVSMPDLICYIDKDGIPMTTPDYAVGDEMNIIVLPAPDMWKTEMGIELLGPRHFGLDEDYVPFQERRK